MGATSRDIRRRLGHPVVDADGHVLEYLPAADPYVREALGQPLFDRYRSEGSPFSHMVAGMGWEERLRTRSPQSGWWGTPARNTRDLATAAMPRLLYERMDEFGIDYSVLYPTRALGIGGVPDDEMRRGLCRGFNDFFAHTYRPFADRLTVAGVIPMHDPAEAVAEIEHCQSIGLKVVGLPEGVRREIPEPALDEASPWLLPGQRHWFDTFGLDSAYDYDPVWSKLVELGFAATCHGSLGDLAPFAYTSISSYISNHLGFFADSMRRLCKSMFLGGVTRRFPTLNIAFLECGVGWACTLLADIVEHWEKRNIVALSEHLDPATIDWTLLEKLTREYGAGLVPREADLGAVIAQLPMPGVEPVDRDEWRHVAAERPEDLYERFVPRFFFGCEADDRTVAFAFSPANAFGARLQPIFSSDIAHWDVADMAAVVADAHGLVTGGLITEQDFHDFVFTNPVHLFTSADPAFFAGTEIESYV